MDAFSRSPSSFSKLISSGNNAIGTTAEDLTTFIDCTPFDYLLVCVVSAKLAAETGTDVTLKFLEDTVSTGASATLVKDTAATPADLSVAMGSSAAAGQGITMQVRCRGRKKFVSPQLVAAGAAITVCHAIYGIGVRDSAEISAHWTDEAGASIAQAATS